jgi:hypothetical protein
MSATAQDTPATVCETCGGPIHHHDGCCRACLADTDRVIHTFEFGAIRLTVEAPADMPRLDVELCAWPKTDAEARTLIETTGGIATFDQVKPTYGSIRKTLGAHGDACHAELALFKPDEHDKKPVGDPWMLALREEQQSASASQEA